MGRDSIHVTIQVFLFSSCFLWGQEPEPSVAGIWVGEIVYSQDYSEEVMLRVYDKPMHGQLGFMVMAHHKYQIVPVDSANLSQGRLIFQIDLSATRITADRPDNSNSWKGKFVSGKKKYLFECDVVLNRSTEVPDWAADIKHVIYRDGIYEAKTEPSYYGHQPYCKVTVANGRIVDIVYFEKNFESGEVKDKNYGKEYLEEFGPLAYAGAQLSVEGAHTYTPRLILSQDLDNIDAVTGATSSFHRFKAVLGKALEDAILPMPTQ